MDHNDESACRSRTDRPPAERDVVLPPRLVATDVPILVNACGLMSNTFAISTMDAGSGGGGTLEGGDE